MTAKEVSGMVGLVGWIVLCFSAAAFGSRYMPGPWYQALRKPPWNPPSWVFAPVWTALYLMMAIAAWRVWNTSAADRRVAIGLFLAQLLLNAIWTWVFFGLHAPGPAFAEIAALWLAILLTAIVFRRIDTIAGALMAPYLAWVSYASLLNLSLWHLNR